MQRGLNVEKKKKISGAKNYKTCYFKGRQNCGRQQEASLSGVELTANNQAVGVRSDNK